MAFELPALPYAFDALEPHIDARTMEIHHGKHHQAYVNNVNGALEGLNVSDDIEALIAESLNRRTFAHTIPFPLCDGGDCSSTRASGGRRPFPTTLVDTFDVPARADLFRGQVPDRTIRSSTSVDA